MAKRVFDWVVSGLGLILLSPVLLMIALAIKMDSAGPVYFASNAWAAMGGLF